MAISLYDLSVPVFDRGLGTLGALLEKGRRHVEATGVAHATLLERRLAPDMLTLIGQVQRASDTAKFAAVRIAGVENRRFPDEEASFADLADRIAATRAFLAAVPRGAMDGREQVVISANVGRTHLAVPALDYLMKFALPNFFFHITTAYDLLRGGGVPIGKMDYLGPLS